MALKRAQVAIPFVGGVNTKTDDSVLPPDKLSRLENGEFTKHGKIRMRPGHRVLSETVALGSEYNDADAITGSPRGLFARGDSLLLATDEMVYAADPARDTWNRVRRYVPSTHTIEQVANVPSAQTLPSVAITPELRAVIWADSRGGVRCSIYDAVTEYAYVHDYALATSDASRPQAVALGSTVVLLWVDETINAVVGRPVTAMNISTAIEQANITYVGDLAASLVYSADGDGSVLYFLYDSDASVIGLGAGLAQVRSDGTTIYKRLTDLPGTLTAADIQYSQSILGLAVCAGGVFSGEVAAAGSGITAIGDMVDSSGYPSDTVGRVAVGFTANGDIRYAYEATAASVDLHHVRILNVDADTIYHQHHAWLASSGFLRTPTGNPNFLVGHQSRTRIQNGFYALDEDGLLWGAMLYQTASDPSSTPAVAHFSGTSIALTDREKLPSPDGTAAFAHEGIALVTFDHTARLSADEFGGTTYLSGSLLWAFDGTELTEAQPLMYPDLETTDLTPGVGGSLNAEAAVDCAYSYRVYYVRQRTNGEKIRSAALTITTTLESTDNQVTLAIPPLPFTNYGVQLDGHYTENVIIEVYRTEANSAASLYYKVTSDNPATVTGANRFLYNDATADSIELIDRLSDADLLLGREIDYLSRGELENIPPPGPAIVKAVGPRVWLAGGAIPEHQVWFSKLTFPGEAAHFSDFLTSDLPALDGPVTALSHINETTVVFKSRGIVALSGEGVDNTGSSGSYTGQKVTADLGCEGTSVVTPAGIMFTSSKGIYTLDQGFSLQYSGAAVEAYNAQEYVGSLVIPGTNQVLFLTSSGFSVMLDYLFNEWSTWTIHGTSMVPWLGGYAYLRASDSRVAYRDPDIYTDGGARYSYLMRTGAFRAAEEGSLQGQARLRRFQLLGTYSGEHRLRVRLYYDRDTSPSETIVWDPSTVITTTNVWGGTSSDEWGSDDYWGGSRDGSTYQFEHRPKRQKFATIRFEISALSNTGAAFELSEIVLDLGVKPGLQKHATTRKY